MYQRTRFQNIFKISSNIPIRSNKIQTSVHDHVDQKDTISTIDKDEISHFKKLVNEWWDEEGIMKALHSMNSLRVPFIRDGLKNTSKLDPKFIETSQPLNKLNILDVGCGGGILSEPLARLGATVTGVDACKDLIESATLHSKDTDLSSKLTYVYGTIEEFATENKNKFDAVVSSECLEHVLSKETFLKSCIDVLKVDGSLFLTTLNRTTLSWALGICSAEYLLKIVPKGTHDWNKFVSPEEVQKILEHNNCQTRLIHGLMYNFLTNKWFWIPNTSVNYALHAVKNNLK